MFFMSFFEWLATINRKCDNQYIRKIAELYEAEISRLAKFQLIERLRQIPHIEIEALLPKSGKILDVGAGRGGFAAYASLKSEARLIFGIETYKKRFNDGLKIMPKLKNFVMLDCDIDELLVKNEKFDAVLLMDILHHNKYEDQKKIIEKIYKLLVDNGKVILLEPGDYPKFRYFLIWLYDYLFYFLTMPTCQYRSEKEWTDFFENLKLTKKYSTQITNRGFFFTRKIMVFEKL